MTTGDVPLSVRGGKNFAPLLSVTRAMSSEGFKLPSNNFLLMQARDSGTIFPGIVVVFGNEPTLTFVNHTGGNLVLDLWFRDEFGSELKVASSGVVGDGSTGSLSPPGMGPVLTPGQKLFVRSSTGDVNAGAGVEGIRNASLITDLIAVQSRKVDSVNVEAVKRPGIVIFDVVLIGINMSGDTINFTTFATTKEGVDIQLGNGTLNPNSVNQFASASLSESVGIKTVLDHLPATGYVLLQEFDQFPTDAFTVQPPLP